MPQLLPLRPRGSAFADPNRLTDADRAGLDRAKGRSEVEMACQGDEVCASGFLGGSRRKLHGIHVEVTQAAMEAARKLMRKLLTHLEGADVDAGDAAA